MTLEEILLDNVYRSYLDRLKSLPPPPEGYTYAYDFPTVERKGDCWEVTSELCLQDGYGRKIRLNDKAK